MNTSTEEEIENTCQKIAGWIFTIMSAIGLTAAGFLAGSMVQHSRTMEAVSIAMKWKSVSQRFEDIANDARKDSEDSLNLARKCAATLEDMRGHKNR